MRQGAIVFALFGLLLAASALLLYLMDGTPLTYGLLGGSAVASFLTAVVVEGAHGASPGSDPDFVRAVPSTSWAAAGIGIGLSLVGAGVLFGAYLAMIGAALAAAGGLGLMRERRAIRRALPPYAQEPLHMRGPEGGG
jgi:hypothetical protein